MLLFAPGITGYCTEEGDELSLELRSLRKLCTTTFVTQNSTVINTIKQNFSPILEDYLSDSLLGFSDAFLEMQSHSIPLDGEEREFEIVENTKMKFCWVPVGESQLGSPRKEQNIFMNTYFGGRYLERLETEDELVRGMYKTNGFWMAKYPVTQGQWVAVMRNNPSYFKGVNLPVESVNWHDCQEFIEKCNILELKPQLPHENQWEYACRGGKGNKQAFYWGDELNGDKANCNGKYPYGTDKKGAYPGMTTEVGGYEKIAPHPWGLCDMSGNVREWCENLYAKEGSNRVLRGGCWNDVPGDCRSADRFYYSGTSSFSCDATLGFRLIIC